MRRGTSSVPHAFVIAGTHSGCGKTTFSLGLMRWLARRHRVKPFKVGPDFIDPMFHQYATGVFSTNLDLHLLGERGVQSLFSRYWSGNRILVVEGVMGLFDGMGASSRGSTAQVARLLNLPVILVVDAAKMAASAAALVSGFQHFDPELTLAGVVLNRVSSERHYQLLREAIVRECQIEVFGYLPPSEGFDLPERHLGLVPPQELAGVGETIERVADRLSRTVNVEAILHRVQGSAPDILPFPEPEGEKPGQSVRVAVARDQAFHFYYPDSLRVVEELGGEWVEFSPLSDPALPEGISGVYLGGGFPEVFARELSENRSLIQSLTRAAQRGMPIYGECGGYLYLSQSLTDLQGQVFPMAGLLPGKQEMTSRLVNFGYVEAESLNRNLFASRSGIVLPGHEFHHSRRLGSADSPVYRVGRPGEPRTRTEGDRTGQVLGSFVHLHFYSYRNAAAGWLDRCRSYMNDRGGRGDCR